MALKLKGGGSVNLRAVTLVDRPAASVSYDFVNELVAGSFSEVVSIADTEYNRNTAATYYYRGSVSVSGMTNPTITNLDPTRATIGADGLVTRLASGTCRIIVRGNGISLPLTLDLATKSEGAIVDEYSAPATGSLAATLITQGESRITNGMTMATNGKVFTTQNHAGNTYVRNPNVWCADIVSKLTCISPWNSRGGATRAGTLITPRHVINAEHYPLEVGDTIRLVAADNTVHTRTVTGKATHPTYTPYNPDFRVYTLNSDLPAAITPCKVAPANIGSYLVNNFQNRPPALGLDQEEKALAIDYNGGGGFLFPTNADRLVFSESKISGDSGNPAFLIVDGNLVLLTVWTSGGAGAGTAVASNLTKINEMILAADAQANVSTGYTVTEADFSAWPDYNLITEINAIPNLLRWESHLGNKLPLGMEAVADTQNAAIQDIHGTEVATQTTLAERPRTKFSANGTPYLDFAAASNQSMDVGTFGGVVVYTALFRSKTATWNDYWGVLETSDPANVGAQRWGIFDPGKAIFRVTGLPTAVRLNGVSLTTPFFFPSPDAWNVMTLTSPNATSATRAIGQLSNIYHGDFELAGIFLFDGTPTTAQIEAVEGYYQTLKPA